MDFIMEQRYDILSLIDRNATDLYYFLGRAAVGSGFRFAWPAKPSSLTHNKSSLVKLKKAQPTSRLGFLFLYPHG